MPTARSRATAFRNTFFRDFRVLPTNVGMRYRSIWAIALLIFHVLANRGAAAELQLPTLVAGTNSFSNASISKSSPTRVLVRHSLGISTVKISDLDLPVLEQLADAGIVNEAVLKERRRTVLANQKKASVANSTRTNGFAFIGKEKDEHSSIARQLGYKLQSEAGARSDFDATKAIATLSLSIFLGILAGVFLLYILRGWCLFRICKKSLGEGSLLVFVPVLRWFPLANAARMARHWLWIPTFAIVTAGLPPPLPHTPWVVTAYVSLVGVLWLATAILFASWCIKICRQVECSAWLGFLLLLPVLEWLALLYLAFSAEKPKAASAPKRRTLLI